MRYVWILSVIVVGTPHAWAADSDGDGCEDTQYAANGACIADSASVDPTVTTVTGTFVGAEASVGPFVALDDVHISPRATLDGWLEHSTQPLTVGAGTVVGRQAVLGVDHILGPDTTISRAVTAGARLTTGTGSTVGYAAQLGTDVTVDANGTVGSLVALGNFTQVGASAVIARGTTVADSSSSGAATTILGIVGPDVTIGADVLVEGTARVRKNATLLPGAQVLNGARVGRGATVEAGATVSGVVRANATVCAGGTLGATDVVSIGGTWPPAGCSIEIVDNAGAREWSDGALATSCETYRRPPGASYAYAGSTGDGVYRVDPTGSAPFNVFCDMTTDTGGWTLVSQAVPTTNTSLTLCNSAVVGTLELDASSVAAPAKLSDASIEALWSTGPDRELLQKTDSDNITPGTATFDTSCSINFNNSESWYSNSSSTLAKLENPTLNCFVGSLGDNSIDDAQYSPGISCGYAYFVDGNQYFMQTVSSSYQGGSCSTATAGRNWNGPGNYGCNMAKTFVR